jgi:hypothetical protein
MAAPLGTKHSLNPKQRWKTQFQSLSGVWESTGGAVGPRLLVASFVLFSNPQVLSVHRDAHRTVLHHL